MTARLATPDDNALLSSIVLHPDVHASNGAGEFNPADYTAHLKSFAVLVDGGCFTARALERASYAIHTNFLPGARGLAAVRESQAALSLAFTHTDAEHLVTMVPDSNQQARWFAHSMGFRDTFKREGMQFMRMEVDDWILQDRSLRSDGEAFHSRLGEVSHGHDPSHDAYVGAAVRMIGGIQFEKAERVYGRWARSAGYLPFEFVSAEPVRIDIGSHILQLAGSDFIIERK